MLLGFLTVSIIRSATDTINSHMIQHPSSKPGCWLVIKPWLDPVVAAKIQFVKTKELPTYIPSTTLPKRLGGTAEDYTYVPPPAEEGTKLAAVRSEQGKRQEAWKAYLEAAREVEDVTGRWSQQGGEALGQEREERVKKAVDAYRRLTPFIRYDFWWKFGRF